MRGLERSWIAAPLALAALAGCQLSLERAACPCADGWVCCAEENLCVAEGDRCPTGAALGPDAAPPDSDAATGGRGGIQRLQLDDAWLRDAFGYEVALAGDVAAIGIAGRDGSAADHGPVAVFERRGDAGVWLRVAVLSPPEPAAGSAYGTALVFAGDALLVGAPSGVDTPGRVEVYRRTEVGWARTETIAPDLTDVPDDQVSGMQFGRSMDADGQRVIIATGGFAAYIYDVTPAGAVHRARLDPPNEAGAFSSAVAIRGSSAAVASGFPFREDRGVYVFEESLGWAAPTRVSDLPDELPFDPRLALDDERLAIPRGDDGVVRIVERAASGWGAPVDVPLPDQPSLPAVAGMAWAGGDLVVTTSPAAGGVDLARLRLVDGAWQAVATAQVTDSGGGRPNALASSGDRLLVGVPYSSRVAMMGGQATFFHIGEEGFVADSTITLQDGPMTGAIAAEGGRILVNTVAGEQIGWYERDGDGAYRRRPSLIGTSRARLEAPVAVSGGRALIATAAPMDGSQEVQTFELGEWDWVAGPLLTGPEDGLEQFALAIAVDGDTAVIGGERSSIQHPHVAFVYSWSSAGWQHAATLEGPGERDCNQSIAVSGARIALACGGQLRFFQRSDQAWEPMPAPELPEATYGGLGVVHLSGDRAGIVTLAASDHHGMSDVFRWADGSWRHEFHRRTGWDVEACRQDCAFGIGALAGDRMALFRDATSVSAYRFEDGAWAEQQPFELPPGPRSSEAFIHSIALTDGELIASVPADPGPSDPLAGAIYVFAWR